MVNTHQSTNQTLLYWSSLLIISLILTRFISLGLYPLYDTTEARYGEIARIMVETNNWVTPQFDYNIPFWGKPPFQTWISALSFSWFGVSEFSARLPHFICGLITCYLVFRMTKKLTNRQSAIYSLLVLSSSIGFIVAIGMVMTDSALLMSYTLAMVSFWQCYKDKNTVISGHLFFVALALGMLIKGPVLIVLIGISLVCWSLWQRCFKSAVTSLPWGTGMIFFLLLTLPWYIWAEIRTPGFLEYFIIGEHIHRFLISGWQGDLYGSAHDKPRGIIWFYWLICASPWSLIVLRLVVNKLTSSSTLRQIITTNDVNKYLICWMISPLLLFSFAGNILPIYVLPGFSALAVLVAINTDFVKKHLVFALVTLSLLVSLTLVLALGLINKKSEAELLKSAKSLSQQSQVYYWKHRPFSAQFYSKGQAQLISNKKQLTAILTSDEESFIAMEHAQHANLKLLLAPKCLINKQIENRLLLKCNSNNAD